MAVCDCRQAWTSRMPWFQPTLRPQAPKTNATAHSPQQATSSAVSAGRPSVGIISRADCTLVVMRYRTFGRTGWQVSEIGYGMWGMGGWTGSDDQESLRALHRAIELGCNFFDTAWVYGTGHSEKLLGQTLKSHADRKLIVATKIPPKNM